MTDRFILICLIPLSTLFQLCHNLFGLSVFPYNSHDFNFVCKDSLLFRAVVQSLYPTHCLMYSLFVCLFVRIPFVPWQFRVRFMSLEQILHCCQRFL